MYNLMNKLATIQTQSLSGVNEYGSRDYTVTDSVSGVPCEIKMLTARESPINGSVYSDCTHRIVMTPYWSGAAIALTPSNSLVIDTKTYDVVSVENLRNRHLSVLVKERVIGVI